MKGEVIPVAWADEIPGHIYKEVRDEYRAEVLAYYRAHGRDAVLAEFPPEMELEVTLSDIESGKLA